MSGPDAVFLGLRLRRAIRLGWLLNLVLVVALVSGCRPRPRAFPDALNSEWPEERIRAAKMAVTWHYTSPAEKRAVLELLVARLDDDDDAVRLFAILALEKLTGSRFGYEYHAPLAERIRAMESWRRYLARLDDQGVERLGAGTSATRPAGGETRGHREGERGRGGDAGTPATAGKLRRGDTKRGSGEQENSGTQEQVGGEANR